MDKNNRNNGTKLVFGRGGVVQVNKANGVPILPTIDKKRMVGGMLGYDYPFLMPTKAEPKPKSASIEINYSELALPVQNFKDASINSNGYRIEIENVTNPYNNNNVPDAQELARSGYSIYQAGDLKADSIGANQPNTITCVAYWNDFPVMTMSLQVIHINDTHDPKKPNIITLIKDIPSLIEHTLGKERSPKVLIELGTLSTSVGDYLKDRDGKILLDRNGLPVLKTGLPKDDFAPSNKKYVLPKVVMYGLTFTALKAILTSLSLDSSEVGIISIMKPQLGKDLLADLYNVPFIELARDDKVTLNTSIDNPLNSEIFQLADKYWYRTDESGKKIPAVGIYYQECNVFQKVLESYLLEKEA